LILTAIETPEHHARPRFHPDVLEIRWQIYAEEKRGDAWIEMAQAAISAAHHREIDELEEGMHPAHLLWRRKTARSYGCASSYFGISITTG
jgi:hypothetical protein